jgi:hypothetical protein
MIAGERGGAVPRAWVSAGLFCKWCAHFRRGWTRGAAASLSTAQGVWGPSLVRRKILRRRAAHQRVGAQPATGRTRFFSESLAATRRSTPAGRTMGLARGRLRAHSGDDVTTAARQGELTVERKCLLVRIAAGVPIERGHRSADGLRKMLPISSRPCSARPVQNRAERSLTTRFRLLRRLPQLLRFRVSDDIYCDPLVLSQGNFSCVALYI